MYLFFITTHNAGSVYCDGHLLNAGMYGESIRSGSVLVVKTHKRSSEKSTAPDEPVYTSKKVNNNYIIHLYLPCMHS